MATTFGIKVKGYAAIQEIAHRHGISGNKIYITILNPLLLLLPDNLPVIPMDNSSQGIETVGDLKKQIELQNNPLS